MACPKCDYHMHTKYLKCADDTMEIEAIVQECIRLGVTSIAITDHLNTLDKVVLHKLIKEDIEKINADIEIFFGAELNFTGCDEGFVFNEEIKEQYGFQFANGGIHGTYLEKYDLKELVDIQHRHHLKTCRDPLVDVLVHPYWFNSNEFKKKGFPWFNTMKAVPETFTRELGQAARETGTAIEINADAIFIKKEYSEDFKKEYIDYLAILAEEGVQFALGSDAHTITSLKEITAAWDVVEKLGLSEDRIWKPGKKQN